MPTLGEASYEGVVPWHYIRLHQIFVRLSIRTMKPLQQPLLTFIQICRHALIIATDKSIVLRHMNTDPCPC